MKYIKKFEFKEETWSNKESFADFFADTYSENFYDFDLNTNSDYNLLSDIIDKFNTMKTDSDIHHEMRGYSEYDKLETINKELKSLDKRIEFLSNQTYDMIKNSKRIKDTF